MMRTAMYRTNQFINKNRCAFTCKIAEKGDGESAQVRPFFTEMLYLLYFCKLAHVKNTHLHPRLGETREIVKYIRLFRNLRDALRGVAADVDRDV